MKHLNRVVKTAINEKKGDVGKVMSRILSAPDATSLTSLHPEPSSIFYYLKLNLGFGQEEACSLPWEADLLGICHLLTIPQV